MAFNNPFLSDKARAWLGSIQNVPENEIPAKANMAAQSGLISFPEALAIKMIADRIRTPQGNMPQGTVMGEMLSGIAGIDAGRMENPSFAGGGIVAFAEGGSTSAEVNRILKKHPIQRTAEENDILRRAGRQLERASLPYDSSILELDRALGTPFIREMFANPYASDEEIAQGGGADLNEQIMRSLGAEQATRTQTPSAPAKKRDWATAPRQNRQRTAESTRLSDFATLASQEGAKSGRGMSASVASEGIRLLEDQIKDLKNAKPEDREARYRAAGIEDMTPAQLKKIEDRISKLSGEKQRDAYLALAQAGFKMAAAASRPGATLMGSLGEGGMEGTRLMAGINKEYRELESALEDKVMSLQRYQQQRREGMIDRDIDFERDTKKDIRSLERNLAEVKIGEARDQRDFNLRAQQAEDTKDPIKELKRMYVYARTPEERANALKLLSELTQMDTRIIAEQLKSELAIEKEKMKMSGVGGFVPSGGSFVDQDVSGIVSEADKLTGYR